MSEAMIEALVGLLRDTPEMGPELVDLFLAVLGNGTPDSGTR